MNDYQQDIVAGDDMGNQRTLSGKLFYPVPSLDGVAERSKKRKTYPQNWPAYNKAQTREKLLFLDILGDLCSCVPKSPKGRRGRPMRDFGDMIFCGALKQYDGVSARRLTSDLVLARSKGYIQNVPHFNTVIKYISSSIATPILIDLIRLSALPLRDLESVFTVDASGFTTAFYSRWFDVRFGKKTEEEKKLREWVKVHLICGAKTNIVTSIAVTDGTGNDSPRLPDLVLQTAKNFRIRDVCADKGYLSRENADTIASVGAIPFIPFKSNSTGKSNGSKAWRKMYLFFQTNHEEFMRRYHQRSNVESTFSMIKRKLGGKLLFKSEVGQVNEALCRILAHNICVLANEYFNMNVEPEFRKSAHLFPNLHINSGWRTI